MTGTVKTDAVRQDAPDALVVEDLSKSYDGSLPVLEGLNLTVRSGEMVCVVGPSGAGKTTLLRCLAGLLPPTSGAVRLGDRPLTEPVAEIGVVFQDYGRSLMPWMRVRENVAFPLQGRGVRRAERRAAADRWLAAVGLDGAGDRYPWECSGGMQQRAAIARALAYDARVLLMDEPFASVDAQTRFDLEDLVLDLHGRLGITVVVVTHDIDEAVYLSDRVIVLSGNPARIIDTVGIDLGADRHQLTTRADPRFAALRSKILEEIRPSAM